MQLNSIRQLNYETQIVVFIYAVFSFSGLEQGPSLE